MLVSIPLHLETLPGKPSLADIETMLSDYYKSAGLIEVVPELQVKRRGSRPRL